MTTTQAPTRRYTLYVVGLLALANVVNYMDRMALSVLMPAMKEDLLLSDSQLGLITGFAFALFYAGFGIPIARWADRGNRRNIITLALVLWSAMTALSGAAMNFVQLLCARVGVGIGEAGCIPPSHSMISDYVPAERRAGAMAVHTAGATVGIVCGLLLGGWLNAVIGWRFTFAVLAAPGLILALIIHTTLREPRRVGAQQQANNLSQSLGESFRYLWSRRTYRHLVMVFALGSFASFGINQWLPSFYMRTYGLSSAEIGLYFGIVFGVGATMGVLCGGAIGNYLAKKNRRWPLLFAGGCYLVGFPLALAFLGASNVNHALLLNAAFSFVTTLPSATLFASTQNVVAPHMRAFASATAMFFTALVGIGGGPFIVGVFSDAMLLAFADESLRYALMAVSVFIMAPAFHAWMASKTIELETL